MSRILCCWEIGAGFGHLFRLYPLIEELLEYDHDVIVIARDFPRTGQVFNPLDISTLPAPDNQAPDKKFPLSLNYAQNLLRNGYWHAPSLRSQLREWMDLFDALQPDFILAEHAPGALLAASLLGLKRAAIGTGFTLPPLVSPMPSIQPWFSVPQNHLLQIEGEFLALVNPVIVDLGGKPLAAVADIFAGAQIYLCTFAELDHYGDRTETQYCGPIIYTPPQQMPDWPTVSGERVFLYLRASNRKLRPLLDLLQRMSLSVLACIPDLPETELNAQKSSNLHITTEPLDLHQVAADCSLMISQGGTNAGTLMLLSGVPVLVCPLELEQTLWGYRITTQGLGSMINPFNPNPDLKAKIEYNLNNTEVIDQVHKFAQHYTHYDGKQTVHDIAKRITMTVTT